MNCCVWWVGRWRLDMMGRRENLLRLALGFRNQRALALVRKRAPSWVLARSDGAYMQSGMEMSGGLRASQ